MLMQADCMAAGFTAGGRADLTHSRLLRVHERHLEAIADVAYAGHNGSRSDRERVRL